MHITKKRRSAAYLNFRSAAGVRSDSMFYKAFQQLYETHGPQRWWPGDSAFEVMVGAVLTQNTAWSNAEKAITQLKAVDALTPKAIVAAHPRRLAKWIKPSGYFNVKARRLRALCSWLLQMGGVERIAQQPTEELRVALLKINGVGPETADDILLYAFHRPVFVIDAYTRRIFARLGVIEGTEDYELLRNTFEEALGPDVALFNEYHSLIVRHAKYVCRKQPLCSSCHLRISCRSAL